MSDGVFMGIYPTLKTVSNEKIKKKFLNNLKICLEDRKSGQLILAPLGGN